MGTRPTGPVMRISVTPAKPHVLSGERSTERLRPLTIEQRKITDDSDIQAFTTPGSLSMSHNYQHRIVRLTGAKQQVGTYQLHISQVGQPGQSTHRAQWNFQTFKGLLTFLRKHFPDSELLHQDGCPDIQVHDVQDVPSRSLVTLPSPETRISIAPHCSSQRDWPLISGSKRSSFMSTTLVKASCA